MLAAKHKISQRTCSLPHEIKYVKKINQHPKHVVLNKFSQLTININ